MKVLSVRSVAPHSPPFMGGSDVGLTEAECEAGPDTSARGAEMWEPHSSCREMHSSEKSLGRFGAMFDSHKALSSATRS